MIRERFRRDDRKGRRRHVLHLLDRRIVRLCAERLEHPRGRLDSGRNVSGGCVEEALPQHSHAHDGDATAQRSCIVWDRQHARRSIGRIVPRHRAQQQRAVLGGARHRTDVIHGPRERQHARAAHASVRRLETGHAAERGRHTDRTAGVGPERRGDETRGHGRAGTGGGTSGHARSPGVPRVHRVTVVRVASERAVRELVHVQLAQHDRAGAGEPRHDRRVRPGHAVGQDARARCRPNAGRVEEILEPDRHAVEWSERLTREDAGERGVRRLERRLCAHRDERTERAVERRDPIETGAHDFDR